MQQMWSHTRGKSRRCNGVGQGTDNGVLSRTTVSTNNISVCEGGNVQTNNLFVLISVGGGFFFKYARYRGLQKTD